MPLHLRRRGIGVLRAGDSSAAPQNDTKGRSGCSRAIHPPAGAHIPAHPTWGVGLQGCLVMSCVWVVAAHRAWVPDRSPARRWGVWSPGGLDGHWFGRGRVLSSTPPWVPDRGPARRCGPDCVPRHDGVALMDDGAGVRKRCSNQADGRVTTNLAPLPGLLSARTEPPWASTSFRTIVRPIPAPPVERLRDLSTR